MSRAAQSLLDLQRQFIAALHDGDEPGPVASISGNGLEPDARLRIYRRSCNEIHTAALRTTYPAVLALAGDAFFEQAVRGYRLAWPSRSGNLQAFGGHFADHLASLPVLRGVPYLPDVARLEWLRQQAALADSAEAVPRTVFALGAVKTCRPVRFVMHPSVRLLDSPHAVLTIWRYALHPSRERLDLPATGERVMVWREGGQVAMAALDAASHACIATLMDAGTLDDAYAAGRALDPDFDFGICIESLVDRDLLVACPFIESIEEPSPCRSCIA